MSLPPTAVRLAAGALLWRPTGKSRKPSDIELAIIHRPRYDDWSWPKGGVEAGEHLMQAAAREVREETGYDLTLGSTLGNASHSRPGGKTTVHWWGAQVRPSATPSGVRPETLDPHEVDTVRWVTPPEALRLLSYRSDKAALRRLMSRPTVRSVVLLVRHASAGSRTAWTGADALRPLDPTGRAQAARLAEVLGVFAPTKVASADLLRCEQTVQPLADILECEIDRSTDLSDSTWEQHPTRITTAVKAAAAAAATARGGPLGTAVICSQGGAIPAAVAALAAKAPSALRDSLLTARSRSRDGLPKSRKGSVWVLAFNGTSLVGADYLPDLAPAITMQAS